MAAPPNLPIVLSKLNQYSKGLGSKPHLSCGPRAYAMKEVLDSLNIKSRIVDLFGLSSSEVSKVSPHTLIEVFEEDKQSWVLQDPDFNVAYTDKTSNNYLSVREILKLPEGRLTYDSHGFEIENIINLQNTIDRLFEFCVLYRFSYVGKKSVLLVNVARNKLNNNVVDDSGTVLLFSEYICSRDYKYHVEWLS